MLNIASLGSRGAKARALNAELVREAYRGLLGREPESQDLIEAHLRNHPTLAGLLKAIAASQEFDRFGSPKSRNDAVMKVVHDAYWNRPGAIEHDVAPEAMRRLVDRIRAQWTLLGETEPHWSVLTHDRYRSDKLTDAAMDAFYQSGEQSARIIDLFEQRTGVAARHGTCLELGCGVGRITGHLAKRFDQVIGVDISPGNLKLCNERMTAIGADNVRTRSVGGIEDFDSLPEFDFFYSVIVLQHNSPPIQKAILRSLLSKIRPGGGAVFQIPTEMPGYAFEVEPYLASPSPTMEVHGLPKSVVLEEIRQAGLNVVDFMPDSWIDRFGSYTFYAVKPG